MHKIVPSPKLTIVAGTDICIIMKKPRKNHDTERMMLNVRFMSHIMNTMAALPAMLRRNERQESSKSGHEMENISPRVDGSGDTLKCLHAIHADMTETTIISHAMPRDRRMRVILSSPVVNAIDLLISYEVSERGGESAFQVATDVGA